MQRLRRRKGEDSYEAPEDEEMKETQELGFVMRCELRDGFSLTVFLEKLDGTSCDFVLLDTCSYGCFYKTYH
jgi:hypothetical protein